MTKKQANKKQPTYIQNFFQLPIFTPNTHLLLDAKHFNKCYTFKFIQTKNSYVTGKVYLLDTLTNNDYEELNHSFGYIETSDIAKFVNKVANELLTLDVYHSFKKQEDSTTSNDDDENSNVYSDRSIAKELSKILKNLFNYFFRWLDRSWTKHIIIDKNSKPVELFSFSIKFTKHDATSKRVLEIQALVNGLDMQNILDTIILILSKINSTNEVPHLLPELSMFEQLSKSDQDIFSTVTSNTWFDPDVYTRNKKFSNNINDEIIDDGLTID